MLAQVSVMYALSNSVPAPNKGVLRIYETQKPDFFCRLAWSQEAGNQ